MSAPRIRASYDQLSALARQFAVEATAISQMIGDLQRHLDVLEQGDWLGRGARSFYEEMHGNVVPCLNRLVDALDTGQQTTIAIRNRMQAAEREAAKAMARIVPVGPANGTIVSESPDHSSKAASTISSTPLASHSGSSSPTPTRGRQSSGSASSSQSFATLIRDAATTVSEGGDTNWSISTLVGKSLIGNPLIGTTLSSLLNRNLGQIAQSIFANESRLLATVEDSVHAQFGNLRMPQNVAQAVADFFER